MEAQLHPHSSSPNKQFVGFEEETGGDHLCYWESICMSVVVPQMYFFFFSVVKKWEVENIYVYMFMHTCVYYFSRNWNLIWFYLCCLIKFSPPCYHMIYPVTQVKVSKKIFFWYLPSPNWRSTNNSSKIYAIIAKRFGVSDKETTVS